MCFCVSKKGVQDCESIKTYTFSGRSEKNLSKDKPCRNRQNLSTALFYLVFRTQQGKDRLTSLKVFEQNLETRDL